MSRRLGIVFLEGVRGLASVDLSPLANVTQIGDYFLGGCSNLTSIDLRCLSNVRRIGERCSAQFVEVRHASWYCRTVCTIGDVCWRTLLIRALVLYEGRDDGIIRNVGEELAEEFDVDIRTRFSPYREGSQLAGFDCVSLKAIRTRSSLNEKQF